MIRSISLRAAAAPAAALAVLPTLRANEALTITISFFIEGGRCGR
jgi:hypothetical protein